MTTIVVDVDSGCIYTDTRVTCGVDIINNKTKIWIPKDSYIECDGVRYNVLAYSISGIVPGFNKQLLGDLKGRDMYAWINDHISICLRDDNTLRFMVLCELDDKYYGFEIYLSPGKPTTLTKFDSGLVTAGTGGKAANIYHKNYQDLTAMEIMAMMIRLNIDKHSGGFISEYNAKSGNYVIVYGSDVSKEHLSSARKKVAAHLLS